MYLIIFEDGNMELHESVSSDDLRASGDGDFDILDVSEENNPLIYNEGQWNQIERG